MKSYVSCIYIDGIWKKVKPVIINVTNIGKISSNILLASEGILFS